MDDGGGFAGGLIVVHNLDSKGFPDMSMGKLPKPISAIDNPFPVP